MGQVNINPNTTPNTTPVPNDGARTAATNNLTWAIAIVLIIAALAVAIVYVVHSVHP
jgi:hypothetical protein